MFSRVIKNISLHMGDLKRDLFWFTTRSTLIPKLELNLSEHSTEEIILLLSNLKTYLACCLPQNGYLEPSFNTSFHGNVLCLRVPVRVDPPLRIDPNTIWFAVSLSETVHLVDTSFNQILRYKNIYSNTAEKINSNRERLKFRKTKKPLRTQRRSIN